MSDLELNKLFWQFYLQYIQERKAEIIENRSRWSNHGR